MARPGGARVGDKRQGVAVQSFLIRHPSQPLRIVQLSDTHFFTGPPAFPEPMWRDTNATFQAVLEHIEDDSVAPDLVVVTGDLVHTGTPDEYRLAAQLLSRIEAPTYLLAGNHDRIDPLLALLPRPGLHVERALTVGEWLLLFADSNFDGRELTEAGSWVDREDRVERANGRFGPAEVESLTALLAQSESPHVLLLAHHPPGVGGRFREPDYDAEYEQLVAAFPTIRAVGAGHIHTGMEVTVGGVPVFTSPSLSLNVDFVGHTILPPGYRVYDLHEDGRIDTEVRFLENDRWSARHPLPQVVIEWLEGTVDSKVLGERLAEMFRS